MSRYRAIWDTCPARVACDGNPIAPGRTMCGICERTLAKREALKNKPLKGERHLATEATRSLRKKEKRHG